MIAVQILWIAVIAVFIAYGLKAAVSANPRYQKRHAPKRADPRPRPGAEEGRERMKSAHWNQRTHLFRADEFVCSACRSVQDRPYKVCPACGSPMKKTKYDASWVDEAEGLSAILDDDW